uniref:NHERF family PDZ scaffold protein 2 n=1 Tax=Catagonus wagneri TaxID=51154 RepID=A0A8C3YV41_9CETA
MARSGTATPPAPAPGAPPQGPAWGLVQDVNGPLRELRPRLCHLRKGPQGYGFNLHSDKSRPGQYIRSVDPGSPAAHSGLRAQDRLIEVNGQNVEGLRHAEVVACIKAREDEARLLVVDPETDEHFKRLWVTPTQEHVEGPLPSPVTNGTSSAQLNGGSACSSRSDLPGLDKDTEVAGAYPHPLLGSLTGGLGPWGRVSLELSAWAARPPPLGSPPGPAARWPPE